MACFIEWVQHNNVKLEKIVIILAISPLLYLRKRLRDFSFRKQVTALIFYDNVFVNHPDFRNYNVFVNINPRHENFT